MTDYSAIFMIISLMGVSSRALVSVMRRHRSAPPVAEQILDGLVLGALIAVGLIAFGARVTG
ncbi:hypothetical protein E4L95_22360 [Paracoccus liaowanqingii]|uniref:Uncharacterized protein n=1 Tax=Paracoccus liaowanqingii TaxID=2560053 RepID=A0A4Z1B8S1_9RHOB|nr:hypothetical protein [Paracoccus liaowanqingii]TGN37677.1 hypothetical protein E4L95_22360 [Paracoccus liaowanqingii]